MREKQKQEELKRELRKVKLRRLVSEQNVCYYDTVLVCICGVYMYIYMYMYMYMYRLYMYMYRFCHCMCLKEL